MSKLIFVTGASGFLAGHIIEQLASQGHRVRATCRSKKAPALREAYKSFPDVEIVEVNDIARDKFQEALKGVDVVIHTATPLAGRGSFDELLDSAVEGALNVLRQAEQAGVKKFVVTSTVGTVTGDSRQQGNILRDDYWKYLTKEQATPASGNGGLSTMAGYVYAKITTERAVWEWADSHPNADVTTINPPFLYGPYTSQTLLPSPGDFQTLSTNLMVYNLLNPKGTLMPEAGYADVREAAKAHVGAAVGPTKSNSVKGRKRVVMASPYGLNVKALLELLKERRAKEIEGRLYEKPLPQFQFDKYVVDYARLEEVTGLRKEDFRPIEQTVLDAIDSLLNVEKRWKENGYIVDDIPPLAM